MDLFIEIRLIRNSVQKRMLALLLSRVHNCADDGEVCTLEVVPEEEAWHYIQLSTHQAAVQLSMAVKFYSK